SPEPRWCRNSDTQTRLGWKVSPRSSSPRVWSLKGACTGMLLSRSLRRKVLATAIAAVAFVLIYQAATNDARPAAATDARTSRPMAAGTRLDFVGTAYCKGQTTASGVVVQAGIAAADPSIFPEGTVLAIEGVPERYRGIYTVMDTG